MKALGPESLMGFSGQKYHNHVATFLLVGEECIPCSPPWEGESSSNPVHGLLIPQVSFPLMTQLAVSL